MKKHILSAAIGFLAGIPGFIVLFLFSSFSGRGEVGITAACILYLYICAFLVRKYPLVWWYIGAVINIPVWSLFIFGAEAGQFKLYFWGLVALLISSYAGSFIGLWLFKRTIKPGKLVKVLLAIVPVILIVSLIYIMNRPEPVPDDKLLYVGLWRSYAGFELKIMPNGTAIITQNENDKGSEFENLNIKVAPLYITGLNIDFRGDSILTVVRNGYYAREYRIDKSPYPDSNNYRMVLNEVVLIKK